jgi:hypothetical protein
LREGLEDSLDVDARWDTSRAYEAGVLFVYLYRRKEQWRAPGSSKTFGSWKKTGGNVVEAVIRSLRKKPGSHNSSIETIIGSGYIAIVVVGDLLIRGIH